MAELGSRVSDSTGDDAQLGHIKRPTKQLRQWARRRRAERRASLGTDLEEAEKLGHSFEQHRIAHLLAERAHGTRRRKYLTTPESRPSAKAVEAHMAKPSAEGACLLPLLIVLCFYDDEAPRPPLSASGAHT